MQTKSHIFVSWNDIPDVTHLRNVENNYVSAFEHGYETCVSYVSYVIDEGKVVAFGSATYFGGDHEENYYIEIVDANCALCECNIKHQESRRLWIDGLVSIKKGCGELVLDQLEKWLIETAKSSLLVCVNAINVMAVEEKCGYYESLGYTEACTNVQFAGTGNIRMCKFFQGSGVQETCFINQAYLSIESIAYHVLQERKKYLNKYLNIPNDIRHDALKEYILANHETGNLYRDNVNEEMKEQFHDIITGNY